MVSVLQTTLRMYLLYCVNDLYFKSHENSSKFDINTYLNTIHYYRGLDPYLMDIITKKIRAVYSLEIEILIF